jgi:polar amino acid transport system substrate-binding protein
MRRKFSWLAAALAMLALALFVAACGGGGGGSTTGSEGTGNQNEAEADGGGGEPLSVGSDIPYPPFEQGKPGNYTGFDIELIEAIGGEVGLEPEVTDTSFETIFRDLAQGKFEAVVSAATITEEREKEVDFSNPYYLSEQAIVVKEGSSIEGLADLAGKTVAAQQGTTGLKLGKEKAEAGELRPYPEGPDAINALKAGVVEAVIIDYPVAQNAVNEEGGIEIAENVPTEELYGIAVAEGETSLLESINEGLAAILKNGTYAKLYEKWFHKPPPKAIFSATHEAE